MVLAEGSSLSFKPLASLGPSEPLERGEAGRRQFSRRNHIEGTPLNSPDAAKPRVGSAPPAALSSATRLQAASQGADPGASALARRAAPPLGAGALVALRSARHRRTPRSGGKTRECSPREPCRALPSPPCPTAGSWSLSRSRAGGGGAARGERGIGAGRWAGVRPFGTPRERQCFRWTRPLNSCEMCRHRRPGGPPPRSPSHLAN